MTIGRVRRDRYIVLDYDESIANRRFITEICAKSAFLHAFSVSMHIDRSIESGVSVARFDANVPSGLHFRLQLRVGRRLTTYVVRHA